MGKTLQGHLNGTNDLLVTLEALPTAFYSSIPSFLVDHGEATFCARPDDFDSSKAKCKSKKIILLARDPKDVAASAYFHKLGRRD